MPDSHHVKKSIKKEEDIEVSDIFQIGEGYNMYFIVTQVSRRDGKIILEGVERDGLFNVGDSSMREYEASDVIENLSNGWKYRGVFAYGDKDINGNNIDVEEILTEEALEEYREG